MRYYTKVETEEVLAYEEDGGFLYILLNNKKPTVMADEFIWGDGRLLVGSNHNWYCFAQGVREYTVKDMSLTEITETEVVKIIMLSELNS